MGSTSLGRVQLLLMQVLWDRGKATAREITDDLNQIESIAHSTVQTLLRGLEDKKAVEHKSEGRTFVFYPLVKEITFKKSATRELLSRVFGGKASDLVSHLLTEENVSHEELSEIRRLINRKVKKGAES